MSSKFTTKDVQELRKKTGVGIMECKTALKEADGNFDEAYSILRKKGAAKAAKKADRIAAEGLVLTKIKDNTGVIVEVNSETDFVSKNERFKNFTNKILDVILLKNPANLEELNKLKISEDSEITVEKALQEEILAIGENLKIRRFVKLNGNLISYIHGNGKIAVLVKFNDEVDLKNSEFIEYAKNIAMQIAATNPQYLKPEEIPENVLKEENEILKQQIINSGKPSNIADKIAQGKINKFYKEVCLLNQEYVKDNKQDVKSYTEEVSKKLNMKIEILKFVRMEKGEGIEKKNNDFGNEVYSMIN